MSRLLENTAKRLLSEHRVAVPRGMVATAPSEAESAAAALGGKVVVKALVPVGKRGKAGAVKFAATPAEAAQHAVRLLGLTVRGFPVTRVLVEEMVRIARELYLSISFDSTTRGPVLVASLAGGVEIEEIARSAPERMARCAVDPLLGLGMYQARNLWAGLGLAGGDLRAISEITFQLYQAFVACDASILEVNPLALTVDGKAVAAAVLMGMDDDALFRQPGVESEVEPGSDRAWRPLTDLEKRLIAVDSAEPYRGTARYTEMNGGDIGFLCGGGGGSLLLFDALQRYGGRPANYSEFGGNPTETKTYGIASGILSKPGVKGFFLGMNITNNTQTDVVAAAVARAFRDRGVDTRSFPALARFAGVGDAMAKEVLEEAGFEYHGEDVTMEDAARLMVEKMRRAETGINASNGRG
jgi:succinyl-CoA synthetase beta subunit